MKLKLDLPLPMPELYLKPGEVVIQSDSFGSMAEGAKEYLAFSDFKDAMVAANVEAPEAFSYLLKHGPHEAAFQIKRDGLDEKTQKALDKCVEILAPLSAKMRRRIIAKVQSEMGAKHIAVEMRVGDEPPQEINGDLICYEKGAGELKKFFSVRQKLGRATDSLYHKIRDFTPLATAGDEKATTIVGELKGVLNVQDVHIIVVGHDWASAFAKAGEFDTGEWRLPYDECAFEFMLSGHRIIVRTSAHDGHPCSVYFFLQYQSSRWLYWEPIVYKSGIWESMHAHKPVYHIAAIQLLDQIRAISIALDAEVATTEVVRAPHKLNAARVAKGRPALLDYHVVNLSRRSRVPSLPRDPNHEPSHHKRLHFRRGHWRHFENHKTWIRWMLCGDADLGFIEKQYRL